jgi:Raf kinase inhibitor-like YbhB/YbcL family protein
MNGQKTQYIVVTMMLIALILVGCGAAESTATPVPPASTFTPQPQPPTATSPPPTQPPSPLPPTDAPPPTEAPPTATSVSPTLTPEPATPTQEPPTPTSEPPTPTTEPPTPTTAPELAISTTAFEPGGVIPEKYSCFGDNVSPDLAWSGVPAGAASLLLIAYDLDAGAESGASTDLGFVHWLMYNIPTSASGLPKDVPAGESLADGAQQGTNDFVPYQSPGDPFPGGAPTKIVGYDGPCPGGQHRYTFTLYVLDTKLDLAPAATASEVLAAMESHVLAEVGVVGSFTPPQ